MKNAQRGFTLLEMMVSLVIFALIGLAGTMLLQGMLRNSEQIRIKNANLGALQSAFFLLERDLGLAVARPENAQHKETLLSEMRHERQTTGNSSLTFLKANKFNPGGHLARSSLEWVRWRTANGKLLRASTPFRYEGDSQNMKEVVILEGLSAFNVRFNADSGWLNNWSSTATLPKAVEITLVTLHSGTVKRLILLSETQ